MNRITRYVIRELIYVFSMSVLVMTFMMVSVFLVQEALRENLTLDTIIRLVPYIIPTALSFAIPGTILFAVCIVYGRMSAANEIVAIKAQGIPPARLIWPGIVMAFLLSLGTLYLNDIAASWGRTGIYRVILNASAKTIYSVLNAQGSFNRGKMTIFVDDVQGQVLINPHIEKQSSDKAARIQVRAEKAQIKVDPETNQLIFRVENAIMEMGDSLHPFRLTVHKQDIPIPLGDVTKKTGPGRSPSDLRLNEMKQELNGVASMIHRRQQELAIRAAFQMVGGNVMAVTSPNWTTDLKELETDVYLKFRLQTEPWRRWASGFSCLCFAMVGAPLAIYMRKSDFWTIFAVCFIPILLAYYPLLMFGIGQAKSGALPPYSVWLGNVVMIVVGLFLIRKIQRH